MEGLDSVNHSPGHHSLLRQGNIALLIDDLLVAGGEAGTP